MLLQQYSIFISQLFLHANMNVYNNTDHLPAFKNAVITIGTFDGVHTGHFQIIRQLIKEAEKIDGTPVLITFYPHPKQVVEQQKKPLFILNEQQEKFELLAQKGIENIVVVPFDKTFSALTAEEYIRDFLVAKFHPALIITGYDHRFGADRKGDIHLLESLAGMYGYQVKEISKHVLSNIAVSSTKIREALLLGNIDVAEKYLGHPYTFSGRVVEGKKLGRTIGFPTANILVDNEHKLIPANAVYAVAVKIKNVFFKGMMNIGTRPTVNGQNRSIEVNIFNFDEDIYGKTLQIILIKKIRNEIKFAGLEELKTQLFKDRDTALQS